MPRKRWGDARHQTHLRQCKNCLASFDHGQLTCPVCSGRGELAESPRLRLSDEARDLIRDGGGVHGGLLEVPGSSAFVVWCEVLVFIFEPARGPVWSSGVLGLVDEVVLEPPVLRVSAGGAWSIFNLASGTAA